MSFSYEIKQELGKTNTLANKELVQAEWLGYLMTSNTKVMKNKIKYSTGNEYNINRFHKLLINLQIEYTIQVKGKNYTIQFKKIEDKDEIRYQDNAILYQPNKDGMEQEAFIKALTRGAFLGSGTVNEPQNKYHLKILFSHKQNAQYIQNALEKFSISFKFLERNKEYSLYLKEGEEISKLLAFVGANNAVLKFEEIRVLRETSNNVNRIVNCETANINKTIQASVEQLEDIKEIQKQGKFKDLPDILKQIAQVRLENPQASIVELGQLLSIPIGKSGVSHRLKKLEQIAKELRKSK